LKIPIFDKNQKSVADACDTKRNSLEKKITLRIFIRWQEQFKVCQSNST